jgi:hypothetical protein
VSPAVAAWWAICGQRRPVDPFAEAGLTRKTVVFALMLRLGGREREPKH